MRRLILLTVAVAAAASAVTPAGTTAASGSAGGSLCGPVTPTAHPRPAHRLRVGVDPGVAGNPVPSTEQPKPTHAGKELAALRGLRTPHRALVVRLNRLFWSGGQQLLHRFAKRAHRYASHGFDVEVQVRYHPTSAENGDIPAWVRWVRHVTDVLGRNPRLVSLTITNEVNFSVSPNTSDGSYDDAKQALVRGVEAAHHELRRHRWAQRVAVGFTFAYRFNPTTDAALFQYLHDAGPQFRKALGFVGLDDYPGTVYPPALSPGDSAGEELATAVATMRRCYLPMAGIPTRTPLWVTENGFPSRGSGTSGEAKQAAQLVSMVDAARRYAGSYHVTDYRWFNLRDNDSAGSGLFDRDGLLRDTYARKPAYRALRTFIRHHATIRPTNH